jgi:hypothetical protein
MMDNPNLRLVRYGHELPVARELTPEAAEHAMLRVWNDSLSMPQGDPEVRMMLTPSEVVRIFHILKKDYS